MSSEYLIRRLRDIGEELQMIADELEGVEVKEEDEELIAVYFENLRNKK